MRRIGVLIAGIAGAAIVAFGSGAGGSEGQYEVRAIFANGGFLVPGEEVRIAGARVGEISDVDVTDAEEAAHEDGSPEPGSAVVVMRIDDAGFQDFRDDASCIVRPQGLLGERFVECSPTEPRASGSPAPPALEPIPEEEAGAGQYLLALERNGKAVDLDLVNNIMEEPYPDRFRLILNDLGAAFAARGEDVESLIERGNPALRKTDEVLAILAKQNRQLAQLARDSDTVLSPLARERERVSGFINNANQAAEATAERRADLEAQFQKLPAFLVELRATMTELDSFAESSTPVVSDLGDAAPSLTRMTKALGPFSRGSRTALKSLGNAAAQAGPSLVNADPVLIRIREVAEGLGPLGESLSGLLSSLRRNRGYGNLLSFLFNAAGATNSYDSFGRLARLMIPTNNCVDYRPNPESSCGSSFQASSKQGPVTPKSSGVEGLDEILEKEAKAAARADDPVIPDFGIGAFDGEAEPVEPVEPPDDTEPGPDPGEDDPESLEGGPQGASAPDMRPARMLLDYLVGDVRGQRVRAGKAGR
ncbi:MAG: MlaD family protein [Solirubrobacterales bacterium]